MKSLTVILPIFNGSEFLQETVAAYLEWLPEVTSRFQVVIVDDGSTDESGDITQDLTKKHPQIQAIYHDRQLGKSVCFESALQNANCELLFVQGSDEIDYPAIGEFLKTGGVPLIQPEAFLPNTKDQLIERLVNWGIALREYRPQLNPFDVPTSVKSEKDESGTGSNLRRLPSPQGDSFLHCPDTTPSPKYSSVAEKRLVRLSQSDLARANANH